MQKIILLSTLMLSTSVMAANTHKSITVDPSFTSKGAIELVENSDKVQIMGKKVAMLFSGISDTTNSCIPPDIILNYNRWNSTY